jgi:hypothetical protein
MLSDERATRTSPVGRQGSVQPSVEEATELWHTSYPHQEPDPYLADYIREIAAQ